MNKIKTTFLSGWTAALLCCLTGPPNANAQGQTGVIRHDKKRAFQGYTLFESIRSTEARLIDMEGRVVHSWKDNAPPAHAIYLLDNGDLLKTYSPRNAYGFGRGGAGGGLKRLDWNGNTLWDFTYADENVRAHHDAQPLPNGNFLMIAWERKTRAEAVAAGRNPQWLQGDELWPDHLIEIQPEGRNGGKIVWEWRAWDHLIQDFDKTKANHGVIADHPELIDINYTERGQADWNHLNAVHYNAKLDQILLCSHNQHEIWVIDHSTTTEEARGHKGGKSGKGGDLLYRWGNPQVYHAGWPDEQQLFAQHDARWIPDGHPGAGNILVFNNGSRRGRAWSTVDEIVPPLKADGSYTLTDTAPFAPARPKWTWSEQNWHAQNISGAHRLPNGNTLICSGPEGRFIEVTQDKQIVWEYQVPQMAGGFGGPGQGPPGGGQGGFPRDLGNRQRQNQGGDRFGGERRGPGGPGGPGGGMPVFRATRIAPNHPALKGRDLKSGGMVGSSGPRSR